MKISLVVFILVLSYTDVLFAQSPEAEVCRLAGENKEPVSALKGYVPKALDKAGTYLPFAGGDRNLTACVAKCCATPNCNVTFMFNGSTCYTIACNSYDDCAETKAAQNGQNMKTLFVWVRMVQQKMEVESGGYGSECSDESAPHCQAGFVCRADQGKSVCLCADGSIYSEGKCVELAQRSSHEDAVDFAEKPCRVGMQDCGQNEICYVQEERNHSRTGKCTCMKGYIRDHQTHVCNLVGISLAAAKTRTRLNVTIHGPHQIVVPSPITLNATVHGVQNVPADLKYAWSATVPKKLEGAGPAATGWDRPTLHVNSVDIAGVYKYSMQVSNDDYLGTAEHTINATQLPKENLSPIAIIEPKVLKTDEGKKILLDGSKSMDPEEGPLTYSWSLEAGVPLENEPAMKTEILSFDSLQAGQYIFRLTVTDDKGMSASDTANVTVAPERDDKPMAKASQCGQAEGDVSVTLPLQMLRLCGNMSSDDKGIVKYTWSRTDDSAATLDIAGTTNSILNLTNLHEGTFIFTLTVEDIKGQTDSTDVHVRIAPAKNKPPVANAGSNQTVVLPSDSAILDGSQSSDDAQIVTYLWTQISGPQVEIFNEDQAKASVKDLGFGIYRFRLNVTDNEGLKDCMDTWINVTRSNNKPPVARAGNVTVSLPIDALILNATNSTDDTGIMLWDWTPTQETTAVLNLVEMSRSRPLLYVVKPVPGRHVFNLTVMDQPKETNSTLVYLDVQTSIERNQSVEMYLNIDPINFTNKMRTRLEKRLNSVLSGAITDVTDVLVTVTDTDIDHSTGRTRVVFYAQKVVVSGLNVVGGLSVVKIIHDHLHDFAEFHIDFYGTLYCFNLCSGHGLCSHYTKQCQCERYWMPNLFRVYVMQRRNQCGWSVLYFVIISLLLVSTVMATLWAMTCSGSKWRFCKRTGTGMRRRKLRRRRNLKLYRNANRANEFKNKDAKNGRQLGSLLHSESDLTESDEDTLYESNTSSANRNRVKANES